MIIADKYGACSFGFRILARETGNGYSFSPNDSPNVLSLVTANM